ncbi:hypothetical protein K438DRAFT_1957434 [Mycena galopus ATCC 62051]|nr:hypothetical protein K438DRAFT_1957434 [Mycena galopus ATCC 62051]
MSTLAEEAEILYGQRLNRYFYIAGFVLLIYDHGLTLESEMRYIWRHIRTPRHNKSSVWYLLVRYLSLCANVVIPWFNMCQTCYTLVILHDFLLIAQELLIEAALCLRIMAMFSMVNKRGMLFLIAILILVITLGSWTVVGSAAPQVIQTPVPGCYTAASNARRLRLAAFWEGLLATDVLFLGLTLYRANAQRLNGAGLPVGSLWRVVIRDGVLYYVVICCANLCNILMYYVLPVDVNITPGLTSFTVALAVTMICRLMLNIHDAASYTSDNDTIELSASTIILTGPGDGLRSEPRRPRRYSGKN